MFLYCLWQPYLSFLRATDYGKAFHTAPPMGQLLLDTLSAPLAELRYICPALPFLPILTLCGFMLLLVLPGRTSLRPYLALAGVACLVSMAACATRLYPILGTRHNLWMLPLLFPVMGGMLAEMLEQAGKTSSRLSLHTTAALAAALAVLSAFYDMKLKSHEFSAWQDGVWQAITHQLSGLGPRDVIITDMFGAKMLFNIYRYRSDPAFIYRGVPTLVSYHDTHILLSPAYFGRYDHQAMLVMIWKAQAAHLLDNVDRFIFLNLGQRMLLYRLILCPTLQKQILYPLLPPGINLTRLNYKSEDLALIAVSKQAFLEDVLPSLGKAHVCLDGAPAVPIALYRPMLTK